MKEGPLFCHCRWMITNFLKYACTHSGPACNKLYDTLPIENYNKSRVTFFPTSFTLVLYPILSPFPFTLTLCCQAHSSRALLRILSTPFILLWHRKKENGVRGRKRRKQEVQKGLGGNGACEANRKSTKCVGRN